ncbi:MAG: hypothetical protein M3Y87_03530 [Myxococcota bacterium]|nr:hypothetical protein [Myxococcota bacterium]
MRLGAALILAGGCGENERAMSPPQPAPPHPAAETAQPEEAAGPTDPWALLLAFDLGGRGVSIQSFPLADGPSIARYGALAMRICHEDDPVLSVLALGDGADLTRDVERRRAGLRCGRFLAEHVPPGARTHVVEIDRDRYDRPLAVFAIATTIADTDALAHVLPSFRRESRGPHALLCEPFVADGRSCAERNDSYDHAVAVVGGYVVAGAYVTLAALLEWERFGLLLTLLDGIGPRVGDADVGLDFPALNGRWMIGPRRWLPFTIDGSSDDLSTAVRTQARAVGWDRGMASGLIVIEPRCESDSCPAREALAAALRAYHEGWKQTARARMDELFADADPTDPSDACMRAQETARVAAIEGASIEANASIRMRFPTVEPSAECVRLDRGRLERAAARVQEALGPI